MVRLLSFELDAFIAICDLEDCSGKPKCDFPEQLCGIFSQFIWELKQNASVFPLVLGFY